MAKERKEKEEKMISKRTAIAIKSYTKCFKKKMKKEDDIWLHKKDSIYILMFSRKIFLKMKLKNTNKKWCNPRKNF